MTKLQARQARATLRRALKLFGPNGEGWIQGHYEFGGKYCALGALHKADGPGIVDAGSILRSLSPQRAIVSFNDGHERTFIDIRRWFKRAIAQTEKELNA